MPKDEWRRARDQTVARKVKFELATGKALSFEFLSDEITPLDKINVLDRAAGAGDPDPTPPDPPRAGATAGPNPTKARPKGSVTTVRIPLARGVSVLVKVDATSKMSVVQALELALAEVRTRYDLTPGGNAVETAPVKAVKKDGPTPIAHVSRDETEIAVIRKKLKVLAETIAEKRVLKVSWQEKRLGPWLSKLSEARMPFTFARQLIELESNATDAKRLFGQSRGPLRAWRRKCSAAKTIREISKLVVQLEDWLKRN
jgi:hypothetical protein